MPAEKLPVKPAPVPPRPAAVAYSGPASGFLKYTGEAVPPGGKVVFDTLPPVHVDVAFDDQTWDARFVMSGGKQRLILTNKTQDMQKKCLIKWNVIQ